MKKIIKLLTAHDETVKVTLDNWGGGMDHLYRRWTLHPEGWLCVDNGEIAQGLVSSVSHPMKLWNARRRLDGSIQKEVRNMRKREAGLALCTMEGTEDWRVGHWMVPLAERSLNWLTLLIVLGAGVAVIAGLEPTVLAPVLALFA